MKTLVRRLAGSGAACCLARRAVARHDATGAGAAQRAAQAAPRRKTSTASNVDGSTPLQWAVYNGDVAEVKRLLRAGAKVALANNYGATPMSLAAEVGNTEMLKVLLEVGADVESPNADGQTALLAVSRTGNVEAAKLLLDRGAKVDAKEKWGGQTPLMWASARRHPAMMQLLISKGADVNAALDRPRLPASHDGRGASEEPGQRRADAAALRRARELHGVRGRAAEEQGADIDLPDPDGVSPLHVAIMNANWDLAKQLIAGRRRRQPVGHLRRGAALHGGQPAHRIDGGRASIDPINQTTGLQIVQLLLETRRRPEHAAVLQAGQRARRADHARRHAAHPRGRQRRRGGGEAAAGARAPTPRSRRPTGRRRSTRCWRAARPSRRRWS